MEIKRRLQNLSQKDQKLNFTTTTMKFIQGSHLRDLRCPTVHLGHLSQNSRCPRPPHNTYPLPIMKKLYVSLKKKHFFDMILIDLSYLPRISEKHILRHCSNFL